jgi:hypothetical protein
VTKRQSTALTKIKGQEIEALTGVPKLDAMALEMFGPPKKPRNRSAFGHPIDHLNHNAELARLVGISDRRMRQIRVSGEVPAQLLKSFTTAWKLWRRRAHDRAMQDRLRSKREAAKARVKALQERVIGAARG